MTTEIHYKSNIMHRFGGESMYELIVIDMVDAVKDDPKLEKFFSSFDTKNLVLHMKQLLEAAFMEHPASFDVESFVLLRHYSLIGQGFNEVHFDLVVKHFMEAMEDSWVESSAARDAFEMLRPLREFFISSKQPSEFRHEINDGDEEEESTELRIVDKHQQQQHEKKPVGRSFSGEGMLRMMRLKGSKRTKKDVQ